MPRLDAAHPGTRAVPAPTPALWRLLALVRRPVPLNEMRLAAVAAGMAEPEVDAALATATRRQVLGLAMIGGTVCIERRRPGA